MKRSFISLFLIFLSINLISNPLHSKLKHSIIIDTDCSDNDLIAIGLLLSHPGISVKAVIISGSKSPAVKETNKIMTLLQLFNADTIPVTVGLNNESRLIFSELIMASRNPVTLICLGPLTNTNNLIENNRDLTGNIEEIIWYNESVNPLRGNNYEYDRNSAGRLLKSNVIMNIISNLNDTASLFDQNLINENNMSATSLAKSLANVLESMPVNHNYIPGEEFAALFLICPELFELTILNRNPKIRYNKRNDISAIREVADDIIGGRYKSGHFVAFQGFPVDRNLYLYDVRQIMDRTIANYGLEEWKACVMTDEFHGHLGVYSIVGAKMGIYAREYFNIGTDLLEITTFAGSVTPYSCMNDGLQVSTGATLGQGTIHLSVDSITRPQAIFRYQGKEILIKLRMEYIEQLKSVIDEGVRNYGLLDEACWTLVPQTSLKFWLEWDRKNIFELVEL